MRNRHKAVIRLLALSALKDGPLSPTHLARVINVPYDRLNEVLEPLLAGNFVRKQDVDGRVFHRVTEEGLRLLSEGESVMARLGSPAHKM